MSAAEARNLLESVDLGSAGIDFAAIGPDENGNLTGQRIQIAASVQAELAGMADGLRERVLASEAISYSPAAQIPPQYFMDTTVESGAQLQQIQALVDQGDHGGFDPDSQFAMTFRLLAARFTDDKERVATFYRVTDTYTRFEKSPSLLSMIKKNGVYDRIERTDLLILKPTFEVVVVGGFAFFSQKSKFERGFGFFEELKESSGETFDAVTVNLKIKGLEELRAACTSQPQMMAKMASIKRSMEEDPDYAEAMTMQNLVAFIEANSHVHVEVEGKGAEAHLLFAPAPNRRFQILKLLDDDFLLSELTRRAYESNSKLRP